MRISNRSKLQTIDCGKKERFMNSTHFYRTHLFKMITVQEDKIGNRSSSVLLQTVVACRVEVKTALPPEKSCKKAIQSEFLEGIKSDWV